MKISFKANLGIVGDVGIFYYNIVKDYRILCCADGALCVKGKKLFLTALRWELIWETHQSVYRKYKDH
jgi:hypothetical protein